MFFASEKEYDLLKKETAEIRDCITKYVGYIIAVTGISSVLVKYLVFTEPTQRQDYENGLAKSDDHVAGLLFLVSTMVIITLLFEVIWYKIKSHNRHTGYLTLLTQEVDHFKLDNEVIYNNKDNCKDVDKTYLDQEILNRVNPEFFLPKNIFSWEFVMSRFNSAKFDKSSSKKIISACEKITFVFSIPLGHKYKKMWSEAYYNYTENKDFTSEHPIPDYRKLDIDFFEKIIAKLYPNKPKQNIFIVFIVFIFNIVNPITYLKILNSFSILFFHDSKHSLVWDFSGFFKRLFKDRSDNNDSIGNIDHKYVSGSWTYPIKVTQISIIAVLLLFTLINFIFWSHYYSDFKNTYILLISYISSIFIFWIWLNRYLVGLNEMKEGNHSIDYYCWTFFIYRVQVLNRYGVIPKYFSRGFIRFYKSSLARKILIEKMLFELQNTDYNNITNKTVEIASLKKVLSDLRHCTPFSKETKNMHNNVIGDIKKQIINRLDYS